MKMRLLTIEAEGSPEAISDLIGGFLAGALGGEFVPPAVTIEDRAPCPDPIALPKRSTCGKDWERRQKRARK